jgi:hypothetical protein
VLVIATNHKMFAKPEMSELKARITENPILFDTNDRSKKEAEQAVVTYLATGKPLSPRDIRK